MGAFFASLSLFVFFCVCFMPEGQVCLLEEKEENCCRGVRNSTEQQGTERQRESFYLFIFFSEKLSGCVKSKKRRDRERGIMWRRQLCLSP